ncbi:histidine containing phosphotransfer protein, putative [Medicago truncatula]|uniref:Histidine-containing phosphotransfer protein n=2 Tax=Medicago truncatula TaxID=3880 RepID=A0A072VBJ0_MEDTR|nr:histidine containing phosphotransfer protein, putative [Medicago truncatula]
MTMAILKGLMQGYLSALLDEGVVNDRFNAIVCLNNTVERRERVVQQIETYFADVDMILTEISLDVDNSAFDFSRLASLARQIEEKSDRNWYINAGKWGRILFDYRTVEALRGIGAEHMRLACPEFIKACDEMNKRMLSRTLLWVKHEFANTKRKLEAFVQMERRIIRLERSNSSN